MLGSSGEGLAACLGGKGGRWKLKESNADNVIAHSREKSRVECECASSARSVACPLLRLAALPTPRSDGIADRDSGGLMG